MSTHPEAFTIVKGLVGVFAEIESALRDISLQGSPPRTDADHAQRAAIHQLCARVRHYRGTVTRYIEDGLHAP
jgi:hypothetical protein